jgi:hypothetical protein
MGSEWNQEGCGISNAWIEGECREGVGYMPIYIEWSQGMSFTVIIVPITGSELYGQFAMSHPLSHSRLIPCFGQS